MDINSNRFVNKQIILCISIVVLVLLMIPFESKSSANHSSKVYRSVISAYSHHSSTMAAPIDTATVLNVEKHQDAPKSNENESFSHLTLYQIQQKFPHGKYWNHFKDQPNDLDSCTDTPCIHVEDGKDSLCSCNVYGYYSQCYAFAMKVTYDYYGSTMFEWTRSHNINNVKPGDVVVLKLNSSSGGTHPVWVTDVKNNLITFADCNSASNCNIRWNQTITKGAAKSRVSCLYLSPYRMKEADETNELSEHRAVEGEYSTDFTAKANCYMTVFNDQHKSVGNTYLNKGESCTVREVYTDGCCKISFILHDQEVSYCCFLADLSPISLMMSRIDRVSATVRTCQQDALAKVPFSHHHALLPSE